MACRPLLTARTAAVRADEEVAGRPSSTGVDADGGGGASLAVHASCRPLAYALAQTLGLYGTGKASPRERT